MRDGMGVCRGCLAENLVQRTPRNNCLPPLEYAPQIDQCADQFDVYIVVVVNFFAGTGFFPAKGDAEWDTHNQMELALSAFSRVVVCPLRAPYTTIPSPEPSTSEAFPSTLANPLRASCKACVLNCLCTRPHL